MHSFLIVSKNRDKISEKAQEVIKEHGIGKWDTTILTFEKTLGIEDVRRLKEKIFLKPFKGDKKAVLIDLLDGATTEAQNSMLKILEEPPQSTILIILSDDKNRFLPTILSRCSVMELKDSIQVDEKMSEELEKLFHSDIGERFYLAQKVSWSKEEAGAWLEKAILFLREGMIKDAGTEEAKKSAHTIRMLQETLSIVKNTNANTRLTLENLFLNI